MGNLNFYILCIIIIYLLYVALSRLRKRMKAKNRYVTKGQARRKGAAASASSDWIDSTTYEYQPRNSSSGHHNHHHSGDGCHDSGDSGGSSDSGDSGGDGGGSD